MSNNQSHVQPAVMEAAMELEATADIQSIEAPMTLRGYLMCVLPAFGGIFFGYDSGYVNGVMAMPYVSTPSLCQTVPKSRPSSLLCRGYQHGLMAIHSSSSCTPVSILPPLRPASLSCQLGKNR